MTYNKTDSRMQLRGKLDSLNAQIILFQTNSQEKNYISDLEEVREVIRTLQKCEAAEIIFEGRLNLFGLDEDEIHKRSHNPGKFYGLGHIMPHFEMKREAAEINFLRTLIRECELISCRVFENDELKINHILNRLSSALYILTYKYLPPNYDKVIIFSKLS